MCIGGEGEVFFAGSGIALPHKERLKKENMVWATKEEKEGIPNPMLDIAPNVLPAPTC